MKCISSRWRDDSGSLDFIQMIVGLLIVGIAAAGTFQALNYGNDKLNQQMRYRKAISIARSYVEYWQGRIHTDFDPNDPRITNGNLNGVPLKSLLDEGDPNNPDDDISCEIRYGKLDPVDLQETGLGVDFWRIHVKVTWWEPGQHTADPMMVDFKGTMVSAAL